MRKILATLALCITVALAPAAAAAAPKKDWDLVGHSDEVKEWFRTLQRPDSNPMSPQSCCGETDAYYADVTSYRDGKIIATVTDDREDDPLKRIHVNIGTEFVVPPKKIVGMEQQLRGNPTGHIVIFLGPGHGKGGDDTTREVICYVMNGGT
jgi:hypothetical protein